MDNLTAELDPDSYSDVNLPPDRPFRLRLQDRVAVERHLLGLMMRYPEFSQIPLRELTYQDFARRSSSIIFRAMAAVAAQGLPTTSRHVHAELAARDAMDALGHKFFVVDLAYSASVPPAEAAFLGESDFRKLTAVILDHARVATERRVESATALYRWRDSAEDLIYVGITDHLEQRSKQHGRDSIWTLFAASSTIERLPSREVALAQEQIAIKAERPVFNWVGCESAETRARMERYLREVRRPDLIPFLPGAHLASPL